jgi:hypothetical protein
MLRKSKQFDMISCYSPCCGTYYHEANKKKYLLLQTRLHNNLTFTFVIYGLFISDQISSKLFLTKCNILAQQNKINQNQVILICLLLMIAQSEISKRGNFKIGIIYWKCINLALSSFLLLLCCCIPFYVCVFCWSVFRFLCSVL